MVNLDRRQLLISAGLIAPLVMAGHAFSAPATGSRMLVIFLRGAYDATNIIVPTGSDFYYAARPHIGLMRPDPTNPNAALPLDADWSLHPALKDTILPLWEARQIAFVPFAGTDDMSRSHFETQDTMEMGQPFAGQRNFNSGFMARLTAELGKASPIAFTDRLPLCFQGGPPIPNISVDNALGKLPFSPREVDLITGMYKGQSAESVLLDHSVAEGFAVRSTVFESIQDEMVKANRGAISAKGFEVAARRIGALMRDHYNLAFVDVGGWDTHINQGGAQGYLATRIGELGRALTGFIDAIGSTAWKNTTVVVVSEFGRTFRENGNRGTDHGYGSTHWVLGGGINGGRMVGPQVKITPETLNQQRDMPVLTDYRALIGGLLSRQFGLSGDQLARVFPQMKPADLGLL